MAIKQIINLIKLQVRKKKVLSVNTIKDLVELADRENFSYFSHYVKFSQEKRREFLAAVEALGITCKNKVVLDLGPGTGDSLDVAAELGSKKTYFIDEEPFFWRYSTLKGHLGWMQRYTVRPFFPSELRSKVDFIWSKGSINCTQINESEKFGLEKIKSTLKGFSFPKWIVELKNLLSPGGSILLMPAMGYQEQTIYNPIYKSHHHWWCPDVDKFMNSYFSTTLVENGFNTIRDIPYYNDPNSFPVAFFFVSSQLQ